MAHWKPGLSSQHKHTRVKEVESESDSDGPCELPTKTAKSGVSAQSMAPHQLPNESAHSNVENSISSSAPIVGHINETRPAVDDALCRFGEQDIDEGVTASETLQSQEGFLPEVNKCYHYGQTNGTANFRSLGKNIKHKGLSA